MSQFSTLLLNNPAVATNTPALQPGSGKAVTPIDKISGVNVENFQNIIDNVIPELTAENIALLQNTGNILPNNTSNNLLAQTQAQTQKLIPSSIDGEFTSKQLLPNNNIQNGNNLPSNNILQTNIVNGLDISDAVNKLEVNAEDAAKLANNINSQKSADNINGVYSKQNFASNELNGSDPFKEQSLKQIFSRLPQNYNSNENAGNIAQTSHKLTPQENGLPVSQTSLTKNIQPIGSNNTNQLNSAASSTSTESQNILASIARETNPDVKPKSDVNSNNVPTGNSNNLSNTAVPNIDISNGASGGQGNNIPTYKPNVSANTNNDFVNIQNSLNDLNNENIDFKNQPADPENRILQQVTSDNKTDQINSKSAEARPYTSASEQISLKINKALKSNDTKVEIQLDPAKLGKVSVNIELAKEGKSTVVVMVEKAETLDLLKADSKSLERALQNAGINADSSSLEFGLKGQNKQFASYNQSNSSNNSNENEIQNELDDLNNGNKYKSYQSNRALDIEA